MIDAMNVKRQYESLKDEIDNEVIKVLSSGKYILGETVELFESNFSRYCRAKYAIGVGNGSDALTIALRACGVKQNDEVITTDMSFIATAEAIVSVGARPVFVDCTKDTYTIDVSKIEDKITKNTKAIIPVHLYGQCADMDRIMEIAKKHDLKVIEDAAQAAGASYGENKAGSIGDVGCFSFFPTKNLGCAGDGGIIITNDENIYRQCKALRAHGSGKDGLFTYNLEHMKNVDIKEIDFGRNLPKYFNYIDGYNSRLDALQAAILNVKLPHLDEWNKRRWEIAKRYNEEIINPHITKPYVTSKNSHIYYVYTITSRKRDELRTHLEKKGIKSGVYFPVPFHKQQVFECLGLTDADFPNANYVANYSMVLPMFPELTEEEIEAVISAVNEWQE